jgi:hypothetical protein
MVEDLTLIQDFTELVLSVSVSLHESIRIAYLFPECGVDILSERARTVALEDL